MKSKVNLTFLNEKESETLRTRTDSIVLKVGLHGFKINSDSEITQSKAE